MFVLFTVSVTHNIHLDYEQMYTRTIYFLMVCWAAQIHALAPLATCNVGRHRIIGKARVHVFLYIRAELQARGAESFSWAVEVNPFFCAESYYPLYLLSAVYMWMCVSYNICCEGILESHKTPSLTQSDTFDIRLLPRVHVHIRYAVRQAPGWTPRHETASAGIAVSYNSL